MKIQKLDDEINKTLEKLIMIFNDSKFNKTWKIERLDDLGEFSRGKSKHRPRDDIRLFKDGNIPLIQTGDVTNSNLYILDHKSCYNDFGLKQSKLWKKELYV